MHSGAPSDDIEVSTSFEVLPQLKVATEGRIPAGILDACVLTTLALVVVLCVCLVWQTREWTRTTAEQAELSVVETIAGDIRRSLQGLDTAISKTVKGLQISGVRELPPALRQAVLFGTSIETNSRSAVYLIGADGRLLGMANDQAPPAVDFSDRAYFEFHRTHPDTALQVSDPTVGRLNGEPVIMLSRRINDSEGRFAGIVAGSVELSFFDELFKKFHLGDGKVMDLINIDGRIVARAPADSRTAAADSSRAVIFAHDAQAVSGAYTAISKIDGRRRLIAYRRIDGFPFVVTYGQPTEVVYAQWTKGSLVIGGALLVLNTFAMCMIRELRRERRRRAEAERSARRSAHNLAIANSDLEQRIRPRGPNAEGYAGQAG